MFDYRKFEEDIVLKMTETFKKWTEENDDIYIITLDCAEEMDSIGVIANTKHYLEEQADSDSEDYCYYKYCEDEWDLFDTFEDISSEMCKCPDENSDLFSDSVNCVYTETFNEHRSRIIECCKKAILDFKQSVRETYPELLLTFNVNYYFDGEERAEIFEKLNGKEAAAEYSEHIDDFV